ncbi:hypothetical protein QVD17_10778 [Tagetes erecta]|uniref:ABC transporter domain-containing protein n=1 Tax=Tagetes erecta TaxID=13708 RepID=A0AAD8NZV7_TARER|nr:hypothetical protein QVD17_10778 [Tagetes erecta]
MSLLYIKEKVVKIQTTVSSSPYHLFAIFNNPQIKATCNTHVSNLVYVYEVRMSRSVPLPHPYSSSVVVKLSTKLNPHLLSSSSNYYSIRSKKKNGAIHASYSFHARDLTYRPPGTQINLLNHVSFTLPHKSFGLIFGPSGSGKTTLLQLIAGLTKPTSGSIFTQTPFQPPLPLSPQSVAILFQFPERYFVADTVFDEITFALPRHKTHLQHLIATRLETAITSVGLSGIALDKNPNSLSGGYKRRLALAVQLVQTPELLVLDEPLAGLDWKARADVVKLLKNLKKELTILVVSHDLKELAPLVDKSWRMDVGGLLIEKPLPI